MSPLHNASAPPCTHDLPCGSRSADQQATAKTYNLEVDGITPTVVAMSGRTASSEPKAIIVRPTSQIDVRTDVPHQSSSSSSFSRKATSSPDAYWV